MGAFRTEILSHQSLKVQFGSPCSCHPGIGLSSYRELLNLVVYAQSHFHKHGSFRNVFVFFFGVARSKDIRSEDIYKMFAIITIRLYYRALSEVNRIVQ